MKEIIVKKFNKGELKKAFNENKLINLSELSESDLKKTFEILSSLIKPLKLYKFDEAFKIQQKG